MPSLAATASRGGAVVAGQHDDADAIRPQARERRRRRRLDRVGDGDDPGRLAVDRDEHRGRAVAPQRVGLRDSRSPMATPRSSIRSALPSATARPSIVPVTPLPVTDAKSGRRPAASTPRSLRRGDDRGGERMLARAFETGAERQDRRFVEAARAGTTAIDARLAFGQGAGLVDDERVDLLHALERLGDS